MKSVQWSDLSRRDLRSLYHYIATDSRQHAMRLMDRIDNSVKALCTFPESGALVLDEAVRNLREIQVRPYRVIYRIRPDAIEVVTVIHGARQLPDLSE